MPLSIQTKSDQFTTSGLGGKNYLLTIDAVSTTQEIVDPATNKPLSGRTTIELHNNGTVNCYIYFPGSTPTEGRILEPGSYVAFALTDRGTLFAISSAATTTALRITEII